MKKVKMKNPPTKQEQTNPVLTHVFFQTAIGLKNELAMMNLMENTLAYNFCLETQANIAALMGSTLRPSSAEQPQEPRATTMSSRRLWGAFGTRSYRHMGVVLTGLIGLGLMRLHLERVGSWLEDVIARATGW